MTNDGGSRIPALLARHEESLLESWMEAQHSAGGTRTDLLSDTELRQQSGEFLRRLRQAAQGGDLHELRGEEWEPVRELIVRLSRNRVIQGFSPGETATFVLSLKQPLFRLLRQEFDGDADRLGQEVWHATVLLDRLGIFTMETYQRSREEIIQRQQQELMELSTPVVKLWEGVVAVPLIGTLDSARTQVVMENLLQRIVETSARIAIIDITGVPMVDTLVAQHLIKTVAAARLMGADCIISGIRPQIAQTIVHLGVVLEDVVTKATLADAIALALRETGFSITRTGARS
jgi:rsbT co-antagonist protein RsbR